MSGPSRGILYVASGAKFRDEALVSARSIKTAWPDVQLAIITDQPVDTAIFDTVRVVPMQGDNIDKVRYISQTPFARTILLDTDTYCLRAFPEVFDLLDRFQLAAALDIGRFSECWDVSAGANVFIRADGVSEGFTELNTGVIAFRSDPDVMQVFDRWLSACLDARQAAIPHEQDQPSFRKVIYDSDIRIATLPSEYCFRVHTPDYARGAVKILHGRWSYSDLGAEPDAVFARLGRLLNKTLGPRVLVHAFGIISGHGPYCIPLREQHGEERELVYKESPPTRLGGLRKFLRGVAFFSSRRAVRRTS